MSSSSNNFSTTKNCKEWSPSKLPYLPDDLLLNCFARVSRLYYPTLSLVSKRFLSLVASLELYETRTLSNCIESCLYVCSLDHSYKSRLFTLCKRPTLVVNPNPRISQWFSLFKILMNFIRKKDQRKPSDNVLLPITIPSRNFPCLEASYASVGSNIYMIGGFTSPSCRVLFIDCRTHTWHEAPSMRIARRCPRVNVLDGKIYVMEANTECDYSGWMEVFDPITQKWDDVPGPDKEIRGRVLLISLAIKGNLYFFGDKKLVYKPKENRWEEVGLDRSKDEISGMYSGAALDSICEIDNTIFLYRFHYKGLEWYDYETRSWKFLKGLEKFMAYLSTALYTVKLVAFGGKIAVFCTFSSSTKKIWCAVVAIEKRNKDEIYGKVEWFDLLIVPESVHLEKLIVATV